MAAWERSGSPNLLEAAPAQSASQLVRTHFAPRAKRVIQLFMNGGPFQGDLFDPKPAINQFAGQRPKEVDFRTENATGGLMPVPFGFQSRGQSGLPISDLLPNLGRCMDDICVIRSLHTDNPNHGPALFLMNNGTITPTRPSMGAWFLYGLGSDNADLPGYVVLCPGRPVRFAELWASSFLPGEFQGTYINHSNLDPAQMLPYVRNAELDPCAATPAARLAPADQHQALREPRSRRVAGRADPVDGNRVPNAVRRDRCIRCES